MARMDEELDTLRWVAARPHGRFPLGADADEYRPHFDSLLCAGLAQIQGVGIDMKIQLTPAGHAALAGR